ncbi:hypothetical protein ACJX0J_013396, partial [Zea mays]
MGQGVGQGEEEEHPWSLGAIMWLQVTYISAAARDYVFVICRLMNVVFGAALSIATEMITVTGIIKYIADVVLLYFEALLGKYSLLLFRDEIYKQYMLTCPNLYNGALSGSIQGIIHYKQDMIFLQVFILRSMLIHIILYFYIHSLEIIFLVIV